MELRLRIYGHQTGRRMRKIEKGTLIDKKGRNMDKFIHKAKVYDKYPSFANFAFLARCK